MTTVVARTCLDMLRARKSRREESFGGQVPESIDTSDSAANPEQEALLADSVGVALLVVLDTLDPAERLAFVLHDMFGMPFDEIASIVGRSPTATRQLASRARRRVRGTATIAASDLTQQREVVEAFLSALRGGDFEGLLAVLDPGVVVRADTAGAMPTGLKLRTDVDFRAGTYFDGHRQQVILAPTWNVSKHLELGADYQMTRLRFDVRDEKADIHLLRLRIRTALDVRASGNAFIQYNSTTDRLDFNVRLRYNVSEGTDLWIVYNEGLDTERAPSRYDLPADPLSLSRALIVKYSHTFTF